MRLLVLGLFVCATINVTEMAHAQTAPPGYHYEPGSFTPTPNDPCWRKEMTSSGTISWVNASVGHSKGVSSPVESISDLASADAGQLSSIGLRLPGGANSISCHAMLTFTNGSNESGILSMNDPGAYAPMQVEWLSNSLIAEQQANVDRLRTAPRAGEQFPGQLWAACAAKIRANAQ